MPTPRREQRPETRAAVRKAAIDLMFERGYHGTSLRDVARQVGVQMSSLYHYFPSKQALLVALMEATMDDLIASVGQAMAEETAPRERLAAGIRAHVMFHATRRKENLIADSELRSLDAEGRELIMRRRKQYEQLFRDVLAEGAAAGEFEVRDATVTLAGLFAMLNSVATWYRPRGRMKLGEVADVFCSIFLDGISRDGVSRPSSGRR